MPFKKKSHKGKLTLQEINITPLMDVLTVLLFFLIKIFTVNSMNLNVPNDVKLPESKSNGTPEELVTIVVSGKDIRTSDHVLVSYQRNKISDNEIAEDGRTITKVADYLKKQMDKRNKIYEGNPIPSNLPKGKIMIHADKDVSFKVLKYLLHTATVTGYSDYQFLTMKPNS